MVQFLGSPLRHNTKLFQVLGLRPYGQDTLDEEGKCAGCVDRLAIPKLRDQGTSIMDIQ